MRKFNLFILLIVSVLSLSSCAIFGEKEVDDVKMSIEDYFDSEETEIVKPENKIDHDEALEIATEIRENLLSMPRTQSQVTVVEYTKENGKLHSRRMDSYNEEACAYWHYSEKKPSGEVEESEKIVHYDGENLYQFDILYNECKVIEGSQAEGKWKLALKDYSSLAYTKNKYFTNLALGELEYLVNRDDLTFKTYSDKEGQLYIEINYGNIKDGEKLVYYFEDYMLSACKDIRYSGGKKVYEQYVRIYLQSYIEIPVLDDFDVVE